MYYSTVSILALLLNHIINIGTLKSDGMRSGEQVAVQKAVIRYKHFLIAANCYFITDITWGILYEYHSVDALFPFLYFDALLYFIFMFLTMLTWIRYIVAYLDKKGRRSKALLYAGWTMFTLALVYLTINRFYPFIFSFNSQHEYVTEPGRHIAFILQIALYLVTSTYMLLIARRSTGREKVRYTAVGLTCLMMELFLLLQIFDSRYPCYAMGLMIGICVIHSFVEADEMKEKEVSDDIAASLAKDYEAMYRIDIETGEFQEFSTSQEYKTMNVPMEGRNFFIETQENIERFVHPDDREYARNLYSKETMLNNLEGKNSN